MLYRQGYDKTFNVKAPEGFFLNGKQYSALSIFFEFRVFDKKLGREILFHSNEDKGYEQRINGYSLDSLFCCTYDKTSPTGYSMMLSNAFKEIADKYWIEYHVRNCYLWTGNVVMESEETTHEQICELLKSHPEWFDFSDNKPCETQVFGWDEVSDSENYMIWQEKE